MATKKVIAEPEEPVVARAEDDDYWWERVPYTAPKYDIHTPDEFVSDGTYNARIKAGETVMIPRFAAKILEDSHKQELKALEKQEKLHFTGI